MRYAYIERGGGEGYALLENSSRESFEEANAALLQCIAGDETLDVINNFKFEADDDRDGYEILVQILELYCARQQNEFHERSRSVGKGRVF